MSAKEVQKTYNKERWASLHVMPLHRSVQEIKQLVDGGARPEAVRQLLKKLRADDLSPEDRATLRDIMKKMKE